MTLTSSPLRTGTLSISRTSISAEPRRFRSTRRQSSACSPWARTATPTCSTLKSWRGRARNCDDGGVDRRNSNRDGDVPEHGRRNGRFRRRGRRLPKGQSGNLVMLKVTPSAVTTVWCAAFHGSGAPIVSHLRRRVESDRLGRRRSRRRQALWIPRDGRQAAGGRRRRQGAPIQRYQTILLANGRLYVAAYGAISAFAY